MNTAITAILPVFFLLGLGMFLRRFSWLSAPTVKELNRMLYWVFLPALLFYKTSGVSFDFSRSIIQFSALFMGSTATIGLAWVLAKSRGLNKITTTAMMQASFRGNLAFIGLPIVLMVSQQVGDYSKALEGQVYLLLAPAIIFYNVTGVLLVQSGVQVDFGKTKGILLKEVAKNPLILSIFGGLIFGLWSGPVSGLAKVILEILAQAVLPLALIGVGASITTDSEDLFDAASWTTGLAKVLINPLCGYLAALAVGLNGEETKMVVILMAAPTATSAFILTSQLHSDWQLTAKVILSSAALSLLAYPIILVLL